MAFPTTGIVDPLTTTQSPLSGSWVSPGVGGTGNFLLVTGGACIGNTASLCDAYRATPVNNVSPGVESFIDVTLVATVGDRVLFQWYTTTAGQFGYQYQFNRAASLWRIDRVVSGAATILTSGTQVISSGDGLGFSAISGVHTLYYRPGLGGSWTPLGSATDATYQGSGYLFLATLQATNIVQLNNYGGSAVVGAAPKIAQMTAQYRRRR
jgi:hypothetical protein